MGTEVLRPQDCLVERIRVAPAVFPRRRSSYANGNGNPRHDSRCWKPVVRLSERSDQRQRFGSPPEASISNRSSSPEDLRPTNKSHNGNNNLNHGQVAILRRGQSLDSMTQINQPPLEKNGEDLAVCGTGRLGPDPEMVTKQIRIKELKSVMCPVSAGCLSDKYAGSAFSMSPSPSSLPLPTFFNKKKGSKSFDDSATRDLRRLLRLE